MSTRLITAAPNETPLARKHGAIPTVAISAPAAAGPMTRAMLMVTELRVIALPSWSSATISAMKLCRVGLSKTLTQPSANAITATIHSSIWWVATSAASNRARRPDSTWVT
jgi:hypothetical protein